MLTRSGSAGVRLLPALESPLMPYALVPMVDVGPSLTQPLGLDQGGNAIHLSAHRVLIWTPDDIRDRRAVPLADDRLDTLLASRRRVLDTLAPDRHYEASGCVGMAGLAVGRLRPALSA